MKLRYLLPFYALLLAVSLCCRKISSEKEEAAKKQETTVTATTTQTQPITGMLELDEATDSIHADLYINVPNANFKFDKDFMVMETDAKYKGISFRYHDSAKNSADDRNGTVPMNVKFTFKNENNWVANDSIRVMSLDEEDSETFHGLKPYFEERMDYFKNSVTTYSALLLFNEDWNTANPGNTVVPGEKSTKKNFLPRITRDDSILGLKLKK